MPLELPDGMLKGDRDPDPTFDQEEELYRRFAPKALDGNRLSIDAVRLPDMSVNRSKYSQPAWALIDQENRFADWGVAAFKVADVPSPLHHLGVFLYEFRMIHAPLKRNYSHSQVQVYLNDAHIDSTQDLDRVLHMRWRETLVRRVQIRIQPKYQ